MYDNYYGFGEYRKLLRIVENLVNGDNLSMTEDDILDKIQDAYDNDKISGTQYDHLMDILN